MKNHTGLSKLFAAASFAAALVTSAFATNITYYVDAVGGNDSNNGKSTGAAWKTLTKVNGVTFTSGDKILMKRGCTWSGQLYPKGSGTSTSTITVGAYGTGNRPIINGGSLASGAAVYLHNQSYWVIQDLEVTNDSGTNNVGTATVGGVARYGILVDADAVKSGIMIQNNYVHNVNGAFNCTTLDPHINGGISVHAIGANGKFNGVTVQNNTVDYCGRSGIVVWQDRYYNTDPYTLDRTKMGTGLLVQGNTVTNSDGDGILTFGFVGGLIQNNISRVAGLKSIPGFNANASAGIWPTRSADTIVQYNESAYCLTNDTDGQGFDVDLGNDNTLIQYNYSHHNEGGFLLMMGGVNSNVTVRYNVSAHEGTAKGVFVFSWGTPPNTNIYNNTIYVASGDGAVNIIYADGDSAAINYNFTNNIIYNMGSGDYLLPTVSGVKYGAFDHNIFYGNHPANEPADANKLTTDPQFVSPTTAGDGRSTADGFQLQSTSPARNSGVFVADNGGYDFWLNPVYPAGVPNRGAYNGNVSNTGLTDPCNNDELTYTYTSNIGLDTTNPSYFSGDSSRFKRSNTSTGSVTYYATSCKRFSASLYKFSTSDLAKVKFYSSPNGTTWTLVASSYTTPVAAAGGWYSTTFTPVADLPATIVYLKIEFTDTAYAYSPQLGQISITLN